MNKKDILEVKRRMKKTGCTFTKLRGCYVNSEKEILLQIDETFLNLDDDEFDKYLEIAKKTLSGSLGNNLLELEFPMEEEFAGGKQQFLMGLRESKLKDDGLLDAYFQLIIDNYDYAGNYLILLYHDIYDVIKKTSDNFDLDESEEVYEYIICAICPVELTKPALGYLADENRIGPRSRDWVVSPPDTGFIFPAFTDRSTDIHSVLFYTKNTKEPAKEIMESVLGCPAKATATEQKKAFQTIIKNTIGDTEEESRIFGDIQESLSLRIQEQAEIYDTPDEPIILTNDSIREILIENDLPEDLSDKIEKAYEDTFGQEAPAAQHLLDKKVLIEHEKKKVEMALMEKVEILEDQLEEAKKNIAVNYSQIDEPESDNLKEEKTYQDNAVVLHVKPEKVEEITTEFIQGRKCLIIPVDEDEEIKVNGLTDLI